MKKTKHNPPKKKSMDPNFIQFSKVQRGYLAEISRRNQRDWNEALESVYQELGIVEKILQSPPGTYNIRQDLSGLDVRPVKPEPEKKQVPEKETGSEGESETEGKNPKDN